MDVKNFYIMEEETLTKKVFFFKRNGSLLFAIEGDILPQEAEKVGEVVYTLLRPSWVLQNTIRSMASSGNMFGTSTVDPYVLKNLVVQYLLRDWSLERKFKIVKEAGFDVVENVSALTGSKIDPAIFDAVVHLYNRFLV
jgi:hypothetical protein